MHLSILILEANHKYIKYWTCRSLKMWNRQIQSNVKVLHAVGSAVFLTRVPNVDLSTGYISITRNVSISLMYVVDGDPRNVVDTQQVNSPPGLLQVPCVSASCRIPVNSSFRRVCFISSAVVWWLGCCPVQCQALCVAESCRWKPQQKKTQNSSLQNIGPYIFSIEILFYCFFDMTWEKCI